MDEFSAEIILAIGAAAVLAALAFRQMIGTMIKLNDELQETIAERRESEQVRVTLQARVAELETQLETMKARLETQEHEIEDLRQRLCDCDELVKRMKQQEIIGKAI